MKASIKTPAGWRRLRKDDIRMIGDRSLSRLSFEWVSTPESLLGFAMRCDSDVTIRRTQRQKKWAPKGFAEVTGEHFINSPIEGYEDSWRFTIGASRKLYTYHECEHMSSIGMRFWLRRGAK